MTIRDLSKRGQQHKEHPMARNRERAARKTREVTLQRRAWIAGLKAKPCMDCNHVRGQKLFQVSECRRSLEAILAEIAKCDLVCSNCHRIRHEMRRVTND